ncbi:hypothetical protein LY76DRAFT_604950 [Colletotrichum caudatum]|nr:hypothetical protein LY76DRAFT_604950 [Colletotrichum caudatum]
MARCAFGDDGRRCPGLQQPNGSTTQIGHDLSGRSPNAHITSKAPIWMFIFVIMHKVTPGVNAEDSASRGVVVLTSKAYVSNQSKIKNYRASNECGLKIVDDKAAT